MVRRTNRVAWGLAVVLAVVLVGATGLLMSRPFDLQLGRWTLYGRVDDEPGGPDLTPYGIHYWSGFPSSGLVAHVWTVRVGNFSYVAGGYRQKAEETSTRRGTGR
jgi:hypothetical protein